MVSDPLISTEYWTSLQITRQDVEFLHNYLFEHETPLTARELVSVFINERVHAERLAVQKRRQDGGKTFLPKESYQAGDDILFPALNWMHGKISSVRPGVNPEVGTFDVLTVEMDGGTERLFASNLPVHALNDEALQVEDNEFDVDAILRDLGNSLE